MSIEGQFFCYLVAIVMFALVAAKIPEHPRLSYLGVGLFFGFLPWFWTAMKAL